MPWSSRRSSQPAACKGWRFSVGADTSSIVTSALNYQSELTFSLNAWQLTSQDLLVGLLNPTITGAGLTGSDYVTFEIDRQGVPFTEMTFTSNAAMLSFFTNNVLDLGPENTGLTSGSLNLEFKFDFNSSAMVRRLRRKHGFRRCQCRPSALVPTPEPSTSLLLVLGMLGLLAGVVRRRMGHRHS